MQSPFSFKTLLLFVVLLVFLVTIIQIGIISIVFDKLGISRDGVLLLLFSSLFGSAINIPLFSIHAELPRDGQTPVILRGLLRQPVIKFQGKTIVALNVGGCLIPLVFSLYLIATQPISLISVIVSIAIVSTISHMVSQPFPGLGIGMPILVAPLSAALVAILAAPERSAPLAYICGTLGVLIGADLLRLKDIRKMGVPMASIGGAGTFDGIFITGIVAVLLA